jgi:hypothetical protein
MARVVASSLVWGFRSMAKDRKAVRKAVRDVRKTKKAMQPVG